MSDLSNALHSARTARHIRQEAVLLLAARDLAASLGTFKATQLYRRLGVDGTTVTRPDEDAALFSDEREVRLTLDRLERRGTLVRARAGRSASRPTRHRVYVLPRGEG